MRYFTFNLFICIALFTTTQLFAQGPRIIRGKVIDEDGLSVPGATIRLADSPDAVASDADGFFRLTATITAGAVLRISHQEFLTAEKLPGTIGDGLLLITLVRSGETLNEVVVSTQKRKQRSMEVPLALTAVSGQRLDRLLIRQLDQLADFVPGLEMQLQSPNNPGFVIRGITSDNGDSRAQPRVSVFQDGVSISRSRASVVELFDMERVEVAKGPQGTLFGRGAQIGAVHLIQNKAKDRSEATLNMGYGDYNHRFATGSFNVPFIEKKLFNRTAFHYEARDGFMANLSGGRLNGKGVIALRNSTRLLTGPRTTSDLILNYQYDDYPGTAFKSNRFAPAGGDTDPNTFADLEEGKNLYVKRQVGSATMLVDHAISNRWDFSSISGFRTFKSDENFDADGTAAPILFVGEVAEGNQYSQEFRLNYTDDHRFSGFVGASYFHENSLQRVPMHINEQYLYPAYIAPMISSQVTGQIPALGAALGLPQTQIDALVGQLNQLFATMPPVVDGIPQPVMDLPNLQPTALGLINMITGGALPPGISWPQLLQSGMLPEGVLPEQLIGLVSFLDGGPISPSHQEVYTNYGKNQAVELFADGSWSVTDRLKLTAGLRGSYENQRGGYYAPSPAQPSVFGGIANNGSPTLLNPVADEKIYASKDYFSYVGRMAVNYLSGYNNVYASVSRGRRPGVIRIIPAETVFLKPEIVWSYELGTKGSWDQGKLNYDISGYYYDWTNFQTLSLQNIPGSITPQWVADDGGKAGSYGIEMAFNYSVASDTRLFGNYSYLEAKFADTDRDGNRQEYSGHRFRLTPKHSFALGLDANIGLANARSIYIRPSFSYKSGIYFEDNNREDLYQKAYGLSNIVAGYKFTARTVSVDVGLYGKNIFNSKYIIDAGNSGDSIGFPTFIAGSRSLVGLQTSVGF